MPTLSPTISTPNRSDAELCAAAATRDRGAFAEIVGRYQNLICSIAYSSLGDLGRSEDVAQETFIAAWQNIATLREPERLKSWLCGIARYKVSHQRRASRAEIAADQVDLEAAASVTAPAETPVDRAIRSEEQELLWNVLAELPEAYREPLVLYYRSQQTVTEVATQLDLSEETVRQRLSRGRKLMKAEVADLVEKSLRASRPGTLFTAAVLAALPAAAPQAAAMGVAAAAKVAGTKTAAATGLLLASGAVLGPLLGFVGAAFGISAAVASARTPRERRFTIQVSVYTMLLVVSLTASLRLVLWYWPEVFPTVTFQLTYWSTYVVLLVSLILWSIKEGNRIQAEEGTTPIPSGSLSELGRVPLRALSWSMAGMTYGAMCWVIVAGVFARDWITPAIAFAVAFTVWWYVCRWLEREDNLPRRVQALWINCVATGAISLVAASLRWSVWQSQAKPNVFIHVPLWAFNLGMLTIVALVSIQLWRWYRRSLAAQE
jgi:RNA polymerase sigma factor (sigma-70 family)